MKIIDKWFCMHEWEVFFTNTVNDGKLTKRVINVLVCKKCGKIEKLDFSVIDKPC